VGDAMIRCRNTDADANLIVAAAPDPAGWDYTTVSMYTNDNGVDSVGCVRLTNDKLDTQVWNATSTVDPTAVETTETTQTFSFCDDSLTNPVFAYANTLDAFWDRKTDIEDGIVNAIETYGIKLKTYSFQGDEVIGDNDELADADVGVNGLDEKIASWSNGQGELQIDDLSSGSVDENGGCTTRFIYSESLVEGGGYVCAQNPWG
jgi:hypothetical protein